MCEELETRVTLLSRLKSRASEADWYAFYRQYAALILNFCHLRGLDEFAACDVLQETMLLVIRKLPNFDYDPAAGKFRNWLLTLVEGKVSDAHRRRARERLEPIDKCPPGHWQKGPEGPATVERAWQLGLILEALERIRKDPRTAHDTFVVFCALMIEQQPIDELVQNFGLQANAIYQIKSRYLKRLREIVDELQAGL